MDLGLTGKRALVTGGSRGIGRAIARALAAEGVRVAICGRDLDAAKAAAAELSQETGGSVTAHQADTGSDDDVARLFQEVTSSLGGVDILVNNAARVGGTGGPDTLEELNKPMLAEDFNVKVMGYLRCAQAAAALMKAQGWGRIVNIDGMASRQPGGISGGMRNAAVANFTKGMSDELGPSGITVNAVHPAVTRTERLVERAASSGKPLEELEANIAKGNAIRRVVDASEIGPVVAFLCSEQGGCITGEALSASGGSSRAVIY